ncbi:MAG: flavodoxin family protein [Phycisphaerae bacterium]
MNVIAFNGSPRREGNTAAMIARVFAKLQAEDIQCEMVQLGGRPLAGCTACNQCFENKDGKCVLPDDGLNGYLDKMRGADGIILASPTYFASVTAEMKALIDRAGLVALANGSQLRRKVGAAVVAVRRAGAVTAYDTMNHFFGINQMVTAGSRYWNLAIGWGVGEVESDQEGMATMDVLGENMAWLLKRLAD